MSSDDRARKRAVRNAMAESGANYTRAARASRQRPAGNLRAVCFACRKDIAPGGGVIHIAMNEVMRVEQAQTAEREMLRTKAADGIPPIVTVAELRAQPVEVAWQVHCDSCNPHRPGGCAGCYWFAVERCSTWAQLVHWTAHLSEKGWLSATDWMTFIRAIAEQTSDVGLVCLPTDRYEDA
jgi:hypothetical protein